MKKFLAELYNKFHYRENRGKYLTKIFPQKKKYVSLPADDGFIPHIDIQWWYWTGHFEDERGGKYGFEVVFFAFNSWIVFKNVLAQAAVSDISNDKYTFREVIEFLTLPKKIDSRFSLEASDGKEGRVISAEGGSGNDSLSFKVGEYEVNLILEEEYRPVEHYGGVLHNYTFGGNTFYYARENMVTRGTIKKNGEILNVKGMSWFDRQYGELYQAIFKGWQWFAIKLNNGTAIMVYHFRDEKYEKERFASITKKDKTVEKGHDIYKLKELKTWKSPHTGIVYPAAWRLDIDNHSFIIKPDIEDQELRAQHHFWIGPEYWEGSCTVYDRLTRKEAGKAYVELNGYSENKIITIDLIDEEEVWKAE